MRLAGRYGSRGRSATILAEQGDEWQDGRCHFRSRTMTAIDTVPIEEVSQPLLLARQTIRGEDDAVLRHALGLDPRGAKTTIRRGWAAAVSVTDAPQAGRSAR
jgi:hypothetical protein